MDDDYEFTMLASDVCPHCESAKKLLKNKIESKKIELLDIEKDDKGKQLAKQYDIRGVPIMIVKNKASDIGELCELAADATKVFCKDKEVDL